MIRFLCEEDKLPKELLEYITRTDCSGVINTFFTHMRWDYGARDASYIITEIERFLVYHGDRFDIAPRSSKRVIDRLLREVIDRIQLKCNRCLGKELFLELFEKDTQVSVSITEYRSLRKVARHLSALPYDECQPTTIFPIPKFQLCVPPLPRQVMQFLLADEHLL